jgi:glyoxylase-like metal-dependent hydrolase (beta-lactamase superfamily II)
MAQKMNSSTAACATNEDCAVNRKCCPLSFGKRAYCVEATAVDSQPMVTQIIVGSAKIGSTESDYIGSSTLIQSNGFNVLVDTSSFRMTKTLLENLWQKAGLNPEDIDMLVSTHGHPDHYGSAQVFSDISTVASSLTYSGYIFKPNPLRANQRYFLNNDSNVEVISTPGHTPQCVSVIVRNVPNLGTVAIVGDLMLYKDDGTDPTAYNKTQSEENRKKVACSVDYIVPGHGPIFQMDSDQKSKFKC